MPVVKTCERCGKEFRVTGKRSETARYCSMACMRTPKTTCVNCGKQFQKPASRQGKYCSFGCYREAHDGVRPAGLQSVTCTYCGKDFDLPRCKVIRSKRLFCSFECMGNANRKNPLKVPTAEELHNLYVTRQLSFYQIADEIDSTVWVVKRLLLESGIALRKHDEWGQTSWNNDNGERRAKAGTAAKKSFAKFSMSLSPQERQRRSLIASAASQVIRGPTGIERKMINALTARGIDFAYQFEVGGKFLCDFAITDCMLIVECDGMYWHSRPEVAQKDKSKDKYLNKCGYTVMRFTDKEINSNVFACVDKIIDYLNSARNRS